MGEAGEAHGGMFEAARRLRSELSPLLEEALRRHAGYGLVLTGHSLGAGLASLLAVLVGPTLTLGGGEGGKGGGGGGGNDGDGSAADVRSVRCYAYAPPAVLSLERARAAASHVTSVVVADDMVPRFGVATTQDLRDSLAAIHREPGLLGRIHARQEARRKRGEAADAAEDELDVALARSLLGWLRVTVASVRPKLYPPGLVLHTSASDGLGGAGSWLVGADTSSLGELRLSGTMGSSHLPQSYAKALLGDCPLQAENLSIYLQAEKAR